jgi:hypothetical protein
MGFASGTEKMSLSRMDDMCLRFEDQWLAGEQPDLEALLRDCPEAQRGELLADLLLLEWTYRRQRGEDFELEEYLQRFASLQAGVTEAWRCWLALGAVAPATSQPTPRALSETLDLAALASYEKVTLLGQGGMGEVCKAFDPRLKRWVALKWVRVDRARAEHLARFRREAEALARLAHPHIVKVHGFTERDGKSILEMEYVIGGTLEDRLGDARLAPMEAARLVSILAWAIHAAHEADIVHRDLKPANVLMGRPVAGNPGNVLGGFPKISDFGLAALTDAGGGQTLPGSLVGTPSYMSPEQAAGKTKEIGPPADVWALGVILYRCLSGELPFCGDSVLHTLERIKSMQLRPLRELCPEVPAELEEVCLACLRKDPRGRPTAAELAGRLNSLAGTSPARMAVHGARNLVRPEASGGRTVCERRPPVGKASSKRQWLIGGGIAGGMLLTGLLGLWAGGVFRVKAPEPLVEPGPGGQPDASASMPILAVQPQPAPTAQDPVISEGKAAGTRVDEGSRAGEERDDNALKMKLCWCPTGATPGFWMGKYEVTQSEWARLMGSMPSHALDKGKGDRYPIYYVSHDDATEFCRKLTDLERNAGRVPKDWAYQLPTDEQWEYACRAGTTTATAFGDQLDSTQANFNGDWPHNGAPTGPHLQKAVEVGSYRPNGWGIYDMHGNVKEFTATPGRSRGGSWYDSGRNCCSEIFIPEPPNASESIGFRVALVMTLR